MGRSYAASDVIILPRVTIKQAAALATALINRGRNVATLPVFIARALGRVETGLSLLNAALDARTAGPAPGITPTDADRDIDGAWRTAYHWCRGWAMIPYRPDLAASGAALERALFADGLRFITQPYRDEWVESKTRLERIDKDGLATHFSTLGGDEILDAIRRAHEGYGKALGITETSQNTPTGAEALSALMDATRRYVLKVSAHVEPDDPDTQALADDLLAPLLSWEYRAASSESAEPADEPEPGEQAPDAPEAEEATNAA